MLKRAILFKNELEYKIIECLDDEHFKYWNSTWCNFERLVEADDYNTLQYVSINKESEIIGHLEADVNRELNSVTSIRAINFTKYKNITFSKDFKKFLEMLFVKNKFRKVKWTVLIGNPAEKMYDKIIQKYGGRVFGIEREGAMTSFKELTDVKHYELFREEFLKKINAKEVLKND